jgi:TIR domain
MTTKAEDLVSDIFINFRTRDEGSAATVIERDLVARFGPERVFRDSTSITAGERFPERLVSAVQGSKALLALIGPRWHHPLRRGAGHPLFDKTDWVRRELLVAKEFGVRVIPVLVGEQVSGLKGADLPPKLSWLADLQYRRFDNQRADGDLARIAADLVGLVPGLVDRTKAEPVGESPGASTHVTTGDVRGNVNTFTGNHGPIHNGCGDQITAHTVHLPSRGDTR